MVEEILMDIRKQLIDAGFEVNQSKDYLIVGLNRSISKQEVSIVLDNIGLPYASIRDNGKVCVWVPKLA